VIPIAEVELAKTFSTIEALNELINSGQRKAVLNCVIVKHTVVNTHTQCPILFTRE